MGSCFSTSDSIATATAADTEPGQAIDIVPAPSAEAPLASPLASPLAEPVVAPSAAAVVVQEWQKVHRSIESKTYTPEEYDRTLRELENYQRMSANPARADSLRVHIQICQMKLEQMRRQVPDICRCYPGKKKLTLTVEYNNTNYPVKVDINDTMDDTFATQLPFVRNRTYQLYQNGTVAVFPPQRWLIAYEQKQPLQYTIVVDETTPITPFGFR